MLPTIGMIAGVASAEVKVQKSEFGATITIDGGPFAEYRIESGHQPVIWPIIGPAGQTMSQQYNLGKKLPTETDVHPHHRSFWFNHGLVNGKDFWTEPLESKQDNQIVHRDFTEVASGETGRLVTHNDWTSGGEKMCADQRTISFGADAHGRWIDFVIEVIATNGEVVFGDTKEGAFGIRVPGTMAVDGKMGGRILNSRGQANDEAWGRSAEWVDYHGPVDGKPAGIVVFDMPDSFRHPGRWHVRTYGLFAANPFGEQEFPPDATKQGEVTLKKGDKLQLHYRALFYSGNLTREQVDDIYTSYANGLAGK